MNLTPEIWNPHNYQLTAKSFLLVNPFSGLFLDPGLGKTSISLSSIKTILRSGMGRAVLLVAPLSVCYMVWPDEISKWLNFNGLTYTILHDNAKESLWGPQKDIYLINPEGLKWLHDELLLGLEGGEKCPFNILWVDESTKFKNQDAQRFEFLCNMLPLFKRRHIMTGTPSPKSLLNLWPQLFLLDQGKALGRNFYEFRKQYFQAEDWNKYDWQLKDFAEEQIHEKVAPLILEMSAEDYLSISPLVYNNIKVKLEGDIKKYYKEMEQQMFIQVDGLEASAIQNADLFNKCHQIANGSVYEDIPEDLEPEEIREFKRNRKTLHIHDEKLDALSNLTDELNGKPILVAYKFKHDLEALRKLYGDDLPYIGSGVKPKEAKRLENEFNAGKIPVLAGNPQSIGHGLNMQKASVNVAWYSLTPDLEMYIQFIKRIHRQGVSGRVTCHHIMTENSVDEVMLTRLGKRAKQQIDLRKALREYRNNLL